MHGADSTSARSPLLAELLGGGALVSVLAALISFSVKWGGTLEKIEQHMNPGNHAAQVLAGRIDAERRIITIESQLDRISNEINTCKSDSSMDERRIRRIERSLERVLEALQRDRSSLGLLRPQDRPSHATHSTSRNSTR